MLVRPGRSGNPAEAQGSPLQSFGLRWLWEYLADASRPAVLDCGPLRSATARVLLGRCGKLYKGDLISPIDRQESSLWERSGKARVFRSEALLAALPPVPLGSLSAVLCWHLLDLVPRDAIADLVLHFHSLLEPGGVFFCLLREPRLEVGSDTDWQLEGLTALVRVREGSKPFAYPALSNRDLDRLIPTGSVKTFLTRSGWREVLVIK